MCILGQNYSISAKCKERGGISRLLLMTGATFRAATWTVGTGLTRGQITAVATLPATSVVELSLDNGQTNTVVATKDAASNVYAVTITATRRGLGLDNFLIAYDLTDCCDLVAVVVEGDGNYSLYGVQDAAAKDVVGFQMGHEKNAGENNTTTPLNTYTLSFAEGSGTTAEAYRLTQSVFNDIVAAKVA